MLTSSMDIPPSCDVTQHHLGTSRCRREGVSTPSVLAENQQSEQPGLFPPFAARRTNCWIAPAEIPALWLSRFPTGAEIVRKTVELRPVPELSPDKRLVRRRECEFEIFRSVEEAVELPAIRAGLTTLDDFISRAQTVLQRRKARSGRSLELHTREILLEERLKEGENFSHRPQSEPGKRPDFLFPLRSGLS